MCLFIVIAGMTSGCATTSTDSAVVPARALIEANCPDDLGPLQDGSFGATTEKLLEVLEIYRACAAASKACR